MRDQRKAAKANQTDAEVYSKEQAAWEEKQREARLRETAREIQERLDKEMENQERERQAEEDRENARRQKEINDLQDQLAKEEEAKRKRKLKQKAKEAAVQKEKAEAEHRENLRRIQEEAERKQRQQEIDDEDVIRKQAEIEETERQQKAHSERNEALRKEIQAERDRKRQEDDAAHAEKLALKKAEDDRLKREEEELQRILAQRKAAGESNEPASPPNNPAPPTPKSPVDYSKMVGSVRAPEIGPYTIGGRRVPIHESQKIPEQPKTPMTPAHKAGPAPIARLGGIVQASPSSMEWKPPQASTPGTPCTPNWQKNPRPHSVSKGIPTPPEPAIDPVLAAKLEKRRAWEAENEAQEASKPPSGESEWAQVDAPKPTSPAPSSKPASPPLTKPLSPAGTRPKPPVKPKRISSATSPQLPSPAAEMPTHVRVDSAFATPVLGSKTGEDDSAWDEPDSRTMRAQRLSQDRFGKQRRAGWSAE